MACTFDDGALPARLSDPKNRRAATWPADTPTGKKLYGPAENLQHTVMYVHSFCQSQQQQRRMLGNSSTHSVASFLFG